MDLVVLVIDYICVLHISARTHPPVRRLVVSTRSKIEQL